MEPAATVAAADPGWAARLVLLDPAWFVPVADRAALRTEEIAALTPAPDAFDDWDPRDADAKRAAVAAVDPSAPARTIDENLDWDLRDRAAGLPVPTLVLGADPAVFALLDPADGRAAATRNPLLDYATVRGAGHSVHRDRPAEVHAAIDAWLRASPISLDYRCGLSPRST